MRTALVWVVALLAVACSSPNSERNQGPELPPGANGDRAFYAAQPILSVNDLGETLRYYEDVLGFTDAWRWEDGDEYGGIGRGGAWIMFNRDPDVAAHVRGHLVWFYVGGVDALYREHKAAGAKIVLELEDQSWGFREYRVEDNNGYHLRIAEPLPHRHDGEPLRVGR